MWLRGKGRTRKKGKGLDVRLTPVLAGCQSIVGFLSEEGPKSGGEIGGARKEGTVSVGKRQAAGGGRSDAVQRGGIEAALARLVVRKEILSCAGGNQEGWSGADASFAWPTGGPVGLCRWSVDSVERVGTRVDAGVRPVWDVSAVAVCPARESVPSDSYVACGGAFSVIKSAIVDNDMWHWDEREVEHLGDRWEMRGGSGSLARCRWSKGEYRRGLREGRRCSIFQECRSSRFSMRRDACAGTVSCAGAVAESVSPNCVGTEQWWTDRALIVGGKGGRPEWERSGELLLQEEPPVDYIWEVGSNGLSVLCSGFLECGQISFQIPMLSEVIRELGRQSCGHQETRS